MFSLTETKHGFKNIRTKKKNKNENSKLYRTYTSLNKMQKFIISKEKLDIKISDTNFNQNHLDGIHFCRFFKVVYVPCYVSSCIACIN